MSESSFTQRQRPKQYFSEYYQRNKERIAKRAHERYLKIRADPIKREQFKKQCTEASRRWRAKHPEKTKATRKQSQINRRIKAMELIGGARCLRCGCTEIEFLEINHKNGGGCQEYRKVRKSLVDQILKGERTTEDLEVLCRVCNALDYLERKNPTLAKHFTVTWK